MFKSFVRAEIVYYLPGVKVKYYWNPVLSDWYSLSATGASPQGHQAPSLGNHQKQSKWGSIDALQVSIAVQVHTLLAVTGTSAPLSKYTIPTSFVRRCLHTTVVGMLVVSALPTKVVGMMYVNFSINYMNVKIQHSFYGWCSSFMQLFSLLIEQNSSNCLLCFIL